MADNAPAIDLSKDGQSAPHPHFAKHAVTEVGPGAGKQMVRAHVRAGKPVSPHFRNKQSMAPPTNADPTDWSPGGEVY